MSMVKCRWCRKGWCRPGQRYCSKKCRQAAFRARRRSASTGDVSGDLPAGLTFEYADPPYVGLSARYYGKEDSFGGEVDHPALIAGMRSRKTMGVIAGWALSCSAASARELWNLCPEARLAPWTKPIGVPPATYGPHNAWEALLYVPGRLCRPGIRDWLCAQPARGGVSEEEQAARVAKGLPAKLPGRKPIAFCAWLFDMLGMVPGDELTDLFPGSGGVGNQWSNLSRRIPKTLDLFGGDRAVIQKVLAGAERQEDP